MSAEAKTPENILRNERNEEHIESSLRYRAIGRQKSIMEKTFTLRSVISLQNEIQTPLKGESEMRKTWKTVLENTKRRLERNCPFFAKRTFKTAQLANEAFFDIMFNYKNYSPCFYAFSFIHKTKSI